MIKLRHNVLFLLHRRDPSDLYAHLVCRVTWTGTRSGVTLNLGYTVEPNKWCAASQSCQARTTVGPQHVPARQINNEIARYREVADHIFKDFAANDEWPTTDEVRSRLRIELGIDAPRELSTGDAYAMFLREEGARCSWSVDTVKKLKSFEKALAGFGSLSTFSAFTAANLSRFLEYLREERGHNDATCERDFGYLRWFCAFAERKRWLVLDDWKTYRPKFRKGNDPVIFLTWDELMRFAAVDKPGSEHNAVRDIFLFCCFTSLRYSDAMGLTWDNMRGNSIDFVSQKTGKHLVIELNRWSSDVLGRYVDVAVPGNYVFPRIPNQVMNRYLKAIAKEAGITERIKITEFRGAQRIDTVSEKWALLSTHAGRRTFICNALMMGIPPTIVMQWTGHSDYRAMKPYIAIADTEKKVRMSEFDKMCDTHR